MKKTLLASLLFSLAGLLSVIAADAPALKTFDLVLRPTRVFKTPDRSHENTETWMFWLLAQTADPVKLTPISLKVDLMKGTQVLRTLITSTDGLKPLMFRLPFPPKLADGSDSPTPIFWPFQFRLRHTEPMRLGVDAMRIEIEAGEDEGGAHRLATLVVPIETYEQKTALVFPFRGKGIILQGGAANGGHRNPSGMYALDAFGLDPDWSIYAPGLGKANKDYPGWGRELIAPADGVVVTARSDRPEQPVADESNPEYFAPEYQKAGGGDPGNFLVIDHGNGEFSMMAHFQAGSMLVKVGDHVRQGQSLGKLGHTGDSNGPHLHYQLQNRADWRNADGLPCKFTNVDESIFDRGTYFEPKGDK